MASISENDVTGLWQRLQMMDGMRSEDGSPVKIIYPGKPGDGHGPDFRNAVILRSHATSAGDIEIHVRSSDWGSHGHQRDPAYNGVVLHVVMWHDTEQPTTLQNGRSVPVLALAKHTCRADEPPSSAAAGLPCTRRGMSFAPEDVGLVLDWAGEARFLGKASRFEAEMAEQDAEQALYGGIMEALGYTKNVAPFRELARRLPLEILEKVSRAGRDARLQRMLLVTAGLVPAGDNGEDRAEKIFAAGSPMSPRDWNTSCVRPQNSPARRLMALGHLLRRYRRNGIFQGLISEVKKAPVRDGHQHLEEVVIVAMPGLDGRKTALLGQERAATIVINVLLPFSYARGRLTHQPGLKQKAAGIYRNYPKRAINSVERHMRRQLALDVRLVNSARRQQGLLHIYKELCIKGKCQECPLANR